MRCYEVTPAGKLLQGLPINLDGDRPHVRLCHNNLAVDTGVLFLSDDLHKALSAHRSATFCEAEPRLRNCDFDNRVESWLTAESKSTANQLLVLLTYICKDVQEYSSTHLQASVSHANSEILSTATFDVEEWCRRRDIKNRRDRNELCNCMGIAVLVKLVPEAVLTIERITPAATGFFMGHEEWRNLVSSWQATSSGTLKRIHPVLKVA